MRFNARKSNIYCILNINIILKTNFQLTKQTIEFFLHQWLTAHCFWAKKKKKKKSLFKN